MSHETVIEFWRVFYPNALKFFFLYTPFFALSMFLCITAENSEAERRRLSGRIMRAAFFISVLLLFLGQTIFSVFGITLDAFRAGVGVILLLSGIGLVKGRAVDAQPKPDDDVAIVPMAIPVVVGPATIGAVLVLGSELDSAVAKAACVMAIAAACTTIWAMLFLATALERRFGRRILEILSKITGLVLASLAAQMILGGIMGFVQNSLNAR